MLTWSQIPYLYGAVALVLWCLFLLWQAIKANELDIGGACVLALFWALPATGGSYCLLHVRQVVIAGVVP